MSRLSRLALNDEGFVFDPTTGDSFLANCTGLLLIRKLREGQDDQALVRALRAEFAVSAEDAERDVADFRSRLSAFGLL